MVLMNSRKQPVELLEPLLCSMLTCARIYSQSRNHTVDRATFLNWLNLALHNPFERGSPLLGSLASSVVVSVAVNCDDALPLKKEQRLAIASVMKALEVRGEDVCINTNLVRREDELAVYLAYGLVACPQHFSMHGCCLRKRNILSIVTTSRTVTVYSIVHHRRWSPSTL